MLDEKFRNIDKSDWKSYRFDEIAFSISERVEPTKTDLEIYVGLEHLDSESIHIKRFGKRTDVKGTKLKVYPGDIIFGRRRAYQRKAAIAEFEGFCSAHSLVLRANPNIIDPKLFPFFLHSDSFMNRAIEISVGSLSPTINWGTLKKEEFILPPKKQQAKIAELLWAADDLFEKEKELRNHYLTFFYSTLKALYFGNDIKETRLIDLCIDSPMYGANTPATEFDGNTRYIRITDINEFGGLYPEKVSPKDLDEKYILEEGDLLLARTADPGRAFLYRAKFGRCIFAGYLIKFKLDSNKVLPDYIFYFSKTLEFLEWIRKTTRTGTLSNINSIEFSNMTIPYVGLEKQKLICNKIKDLNSKIYFLNQHIEKSLLLNKSILNVIF